MKDLYTENYKTLMKEIKHKQMERYIMFLDWKNQYCENVHTTQSNLQIHYKFYQNPNNIFHRNRKSILKFLWNHERPQRVNTILEKNNNTQDILLSVFKLYYKDIKIKALWYRHKFINQ